MSRSRLCSAVWLLLFLALLQRPARAVEFSDVPRWHWAWCYIQGVSDADIATGYADGTYRPGRVVTRGQMAIFVARAMCGGEAGVPEATGEPRFPDVPAGDPIFKYVQYLAQAGVVEGYWDGLYHPEREVTRGQMAVFVARAMLEGEPVPADTDGGTFRDVRPNNAWAWCYDAVEYCAANGVVEGYWDGRYHPERLVTRAQMAVYLCRAYDLPTPPPTYNITDYFPLAEGDTWTYDGDFGFHTEAIAGTVEVSGTECQRMQSSLGPTLYWAAAPDGLRFGGGEEGTTVVTIDPLLLIPNGLQVGDTGTMSADVYVGGVTAGEVTVSYTFLGFETVTVSAGTFADCMKLEVQVAAPQDLADHSLVWLAWGVGAVKQDSRPFGGSHWNELVVATIGGTDYPADRGSYTSAHYQPLQVATQRVFDGAGGLRTEEIVGVETVGDAAAFRLDLGPTYGEWSNPNRRYQRLVDGAVALVGQYDAAQDKLLTCSPPVALPATMQLGDHDVLSVEVLADGSHVGVLEFDWALVGIETVTTPAGTFHNCLKLHTQTSGCGGPTSQLEWYAPGVGLVEVDQRPFGVEYWQELVSAHADGVAYPVEPNRSYDISDYFDLRVGNEWSLAAGAVPPLPLQVVGTMDEVGHEWAGVAPTEGADTLTFFLRTDDSGFYYLGYSGGFVGTVRFSPPIHVPNGLVPGQSITQHVTMTEDGVSLGELQLECTFAGPEAVSTPAGLFPDCMRLEYILRWPAGVTEAGTVWLARGVGMVKQTIETYQTSETLASALIGEVSYPSDPDRTYNLTDYWPLAMDNSWMERFGGEWLSAERRVIDGTQDVSGLGITDTVYRVSSYGEDGYAGSDLFATRTDGLARYGYADPEGLALVANPPLLVPNGVRVGDVGSQQSTLSVWTGASWATDGTVTADWEVVAAGPVTTEAGYFPDCVLLKERPAMAGFDEFTEYLWLARGVGPVLTYRLGEPTWASLMGATIADARIPDVSAPPAVIGMRLDASETAGLDLSAGTMTSAADQIDLSYHIVASPQLQGELHCATENGLSYATGSGADPFLAYREFATTLPWEYAVSGAGWATAATIWTSYWSGADNILAVATREGGYALVRLTLIGDGYVDLDVVCPYGGFSQP